MNADEFSIQYTLSCPPLLSYVSVSIPNPNAPTLQCKNPTWLGAPQKSPWKVVYDMWQPNEILTTLYQPLSAVRNWDKFWKYFCICSFKK